MSKFFTLFILLAVSVLAVNAQSIKREKVSSSFLAYPQINVSNIDISSVKAEFCKGDLTFGSKSIQKTTNVCTTKDNSIKNAKAIDVFYYKVTTNEQEAYLKLLNSAGEIVYIAKTQNASESFAKFGDEKCYWAEPLVESAYKKEGAVFEKNQIAASLSNSRKDAQAFINSSLFFSYEPEEFTVDYLKSKDYDYSEIEEIAKVAVEAYNLLANEAQNEEGRAKLIEAVKVWDAALDESTPKEKESRINRKATLVLAENSARAKMYLMQYDAAEKTINKALALEGSLSTNSTDRRKALLSNIKRLKRAYILNKETEINMKQSNIAITDIGAESLSTFKMEYEKFVQETGASIQAEEKEAYDKGVESGEVNPYAAFVISSGTNGRILVLPDLTAKMMGTFGGEKLDEFPKEIFQLTDLTTLKLRGNNIKEIPVEIVNMTSLKQLNLSNNQLTHLPKEIGQLTELKTLNVIKGNNIPENEITAIQELLPNCKIK